MKKEFETSESMRIGILLAICGGFMDAYSYTCRGGVFANAATGNIVLLAISLGNHNIRNILPNTYSFICRGSYDFPARKNNSQK